MVKVVVVVGEVVRREMHWVRGRSNPRAAGRDRHPPSVRATAHRERTKRATVKFSLPDHHHHCLDAPGTAGCTHGTTATHCLYISTSQHSSTSSRPIFLTTACTSPAMTESTNGSAQPAAHLGLNLGQGGSDPGSAGSSRQPPARQQQPSPPPTQAAQQPPQQPQQPVAPPPAQPPAQPAAQPEPARGQPAQQHPEQQLAPAVPQQDQQPAARAEDPVQEGQARGAVHAAAAPSVDLVAAIRDPNFLALWQQQLGNAATSAADPVAPTVGTLPVVPVSRRRELGPIVPGFRADPYARPPPPLLSSL
ncbi:hypothetical protein BC629DRAFT_157582 [Irpex lacteus]|nr:hypothetical protein BC629DRAFT_157582 [Irpex lacteus]